MVKSCLIYLTFISECILLGTESQFVYDSIARRQQPQQDDVQHGHTSDCYFVGTDGI